MKSDRHTPGPWLWSRIRMPDGADGMALLGGFKGGGHGFGILCCDGMENSPQELNAADASLIAAAPALYAALEVYLNAGHKEARRNAYVLAKAALKAARGET